MENENMQAKELSDNELSKVAGGVSAKEKACSAVYWNYMQPQVAVIKAAGMMAQYNEVRACFKNNFDLLGGMYVAGAAAESSLGTPKGRDAFHKIAIACNVKAKDLGLL